MPNYYYDVVQGSSRWTELRAGRPCSSEFDKIITPSGEPSKSAGDYANILIVETILQRPMGCVEMPWMTRGKELEEEAVRFYEFQRDIATVPIGFVTSDDERIGTSPDRLVGDRGLVEIKAPLESTHSKYLSAHINALLGEAAGSAAVEKVYRVQIAGQLLITERDWVDIQSYFPNLPSVITRVHRDEPFIAKLKAELAKFLDLFDARLERLRALGYLDGAATQARSANRAPEPKDAGAFGVSESDIDAYIADLKRKGQLPGELKVEVA